MANPVPPQTLQEAIRYFTDPDTCLSYPRRPYPDDAVVPKDRIRPVLDTLRALRALPNRATANHAAASAMRRPLETSEDEER